MASGIAVCSAAIAAPPVAPPAGYRIDEEFNQTSPDGTITIEEYLNKDTDLETGKFDVPAIFSRGNAQALVPR